LSPTNTNEIRVAIFRKVDLTLPSPWERTTVRSTSAADLNQFVLLNNI
jgi:hypothetical protein